MAVKEADEFLKLSTDQIHSHLEIIINHQIPIRRQRKDGKFSFIPPKDFDLYLKNQDMTFYIDKDSMTKLKTKKALADRQSEIEVVNNDPIPYEDSPVDTVFERELQRAEEMDITERIQTIINNNFKMKGYVQDAVGFNPRTISEIGNIFASTLCMNKATFEDNLRGDMLQAHMHQVVKGTNLIIDNLVSLLHRSKTTYKDLAQLHYIDTGSSTLDHMNRMLIRFVAFLFFYNSYFQKYSLEVKRFRAHFKKVFYPLYDKIFRGSQNINLEIVFKGGIKPITERALFIEYCMGGFMHDIGKMPNIKYHDGEVAYDPKQVIRHVFDSYNMLLQSKEFSEGIVSTGLLHHDFYGAPYGYNQLKTFQKKYTDRREEDRKDSLTKYFISFKILDVGYGAAIAYFPTKMLELLDVFDGLVDEKSHSDEGTFSNEDALIEMRKKYIDGNHLGLDPILFNIFVDFLEKSGIVYDPNILKTVKISEQ